jgi:CheY-like chemotaxis protein
MVEPTLTTRCTPTADRSRASVRILVVEDDPDLLEAIRGWLETRPGIETYAFTSAEEAVASDLPSGFDLCLLDYRLGGVDGVMLGAMIREIDPRTRLVLMSGVLTPRVERLALEHGFQSVITKPVSLTALERLLFDSAGVAA